MTRYKIVYIIRANIISKQLCSLSKPGDNMRKGNVLDAEEKEKIRKIMSATNRDCRTLSRELDVGYFQIYNPLNNRTKCGIETAKKLRDFICRNRKFI